HPAVDGASAVVADRVAVLALLRARGRRAPAHIRGAAAAASLRSVASSAVENEPATVAHVAAVAGARERHAWVRTAAIRSAASAVRRCGCGVAHAAHVRVPASVRDGAAVRGARRAVLRLALALVLDACLVCVRALTAIERRTAAVVDDPARGAELGA